MERYFQSSLAESTQRIYNSAKRQYLQFCKDKLLLPLPASENQLCQFKSFVAIQSLCHSSIRSYLATIRHLHVSEGYGDPHISNMVRLEQVLKEIKMVQSKGPRRMERLQIIPNSWPHSEITGREGRTVLTVECSGQLSLCASSGSCSRERLPSPPLRHMTRMPTSVSKMWHQTPSTVLSVFGFT